MGEPAGIGTEVVLKSYARFAAEPPGNAPVFFLIDDPARVEKIVRTVGVGVRVGSIERAADAAAVFPAALPVLPLARGVTDALLHVTPGTPSGATADAVTGSIDQAVALCLAGEAAGVATAPIHKKVLLDAGFSYPGHTEYLGALTDDAALPQGFVRGPVMMLAAGRFRVVPVTIHERLADVPSLLTADRIVRTGMVTAQALRRDFGVREPRLAVTGLNPHAGEGGAMGTEERDVIEPAIAALREQGVEAFGPIPADTLFHEEARVAYDAALAMYHDQALIPIKTVAFHDAVNVTLGLPVVRTSPDHGTAFPIAGRGVARADSMTGAILQAARMAAARAAFAS
ncbi:4-hydroxythreonine-4-phosphate dehydrogenase PdxA [Parvularcula dongshanensis]